MILFTPLECDCEGTEWRRWETGVHPAPGPHLLYLPMERRRKKVTKARVLSLIRKGLMSCFGPGYPLQGAIQGPGADHHRWWVQTQVWIWPCPGRHTEYWCVFTCDIFRAVKERQRQTETGGQVEFTTGFLPVVSHCRKAKLFPDLGLHPSIVPCPYPSHLLVFLFFPSIHPPIFTFLSFCSTSHLFTFFLLILALVAVGPAGRHGTK